MATLIVVWAMIGGAFMGIFTIAMSNKKAKALFDKYLWDGEDDET